MAELVKIVKTQDEATAFIAAVQARSQDYTPVMEQIIAPRLLVIEHENFARQGNVEGGWPALSTKEPPPGGYAAWKAKHYPGKTILRREDKLYNSLGFDFTALSAEAGPSADIVYAANHNFGGTVPKREYAIMSDQDADSFEESILDYLVGEQQAAA